MTVSHTEELLEDIQQGKMVILVDDEDRENEGDLTMAAEMVTPEAINFMAPHGRGLVCLSMTPEKADELELPDHTIKSETWDVPAAGQDLWWKPIVDSGITESRCIKAVETRPSAAAIGSTHHANSHFKVLNENGEWVSSLTLDEVKINAGIIPWMFKMRVEE